VMVAARYREHQYLIGPETFPFYLQALKVVVSLLLLVTVVLAGVEMAFGSGDMVRATVQAINSIASGALISFGIVTLIFAVIERPYRAYADKLDWKLDELPTLDDLAKDRRRDAPLEIVAGTIFLAWWLGFIPFPPRDWHQFTVTPAPIWFELYW